MTEARDGQDRLFAGSGRGYARPRSAPWRPRRRYRADLLALLLAFVSVAFVAATLIGDGHSRALFGPPMAPAATTHVAHFSECGSGPRVTCVVDGDTIWLDGTKIRVADIDTPEVSQPSCAAELALGRKATARLTALLNQGPFEVEPYQRDEDVYGRKLRILSRDGTSLGAVLVGEGLAHVWDGSRHPWCQ